jgi:hypothetical protein
MMHLYWIRIGPKSMTGALRREEDSQSWWFMPVIPAIPEAEKLLGVKGRGGKAREGRKREREGGRKREREEGKKKGKGRHAEIDSKLKRYTQKDPEDRGQGGTVETGITQL